MLYAQLIVSYTACPGGGDQYPRSVRNRVVNLPSNPSLPNLISWFLVKQQVLDAELVEHGGKCCRK